MGEKKKIKVKVKKRKLKIKRILILLLIIILLVLIFLYIKSIPIKNIYIIGNSFIKDKEIIEKADISGYPSFLQTSNKEIKRKIKNIPYIKDVKIEKKLLGKIYIYITEKKGLVIYNNKIIFEDATELDNIYNINYYPVLTSDISDIKEKFVSKFSLINDDILVKISEVTYSPNEVDKERFVLKMNDGNLVYITLNKITKINKYNRIYSELDGKKGIVYLDSGDYVEIKEE